MPWFATRALKLKLSKDVLNADARIALMRNV
jgi:hypothetical protein